LLESSQVNGTIPDIKYVELIMVNPNTSSLDIYTENYNVAFDTGYTFAFDAIVVYNNGVSITFEPEPEPEPMPEPEPEPEP